MLPTLCRSATTILLSVLCAFGQCVSAQTSQSLANEEVRFPSDPGTMLAGTLEKPRGAGAGPYPAVVIISGTGPWTRGGWVNIRARLRASGIATLMYDKRGQGQSTGVFVDTIPAMETDVAAAVKFLRTRPDIGAGRIALLGTSQGAVAAPMVASRDPMIAAVVMLSGPIGQRGELFLGILRSHLKRAGKTPEQVAEVAATIGAWMEGRSRNGGAVELGQMREASVAAFAKVGFPGPQARDFVAALDNDVVLSMFEAAPDRALEALRAPVLAIYGSKDDVIAPALSTEAAAVSLRDNRDALIALVPGMTHELTRAAPATIAAAGSEDGTMPIVTDMVGDWLARRLTAVPQSR